MINKNFVSHFASEHCKYEGAVDRVKLWCGRSKEYLGNRAKEKKLKSKYITLSKLSDGGYIGYMVIGRIYTQFKVYI